MSTTTLSDENEIEGSVVAVIHVDDSGADPARTVLALTTKEDLSITIDEDNEDFNPGAFRRTQRYRTNNTIDLEVSSAVAVSTDALQLIGLLDANGEVLFEDTRKILASNDEYIELAYFASEPDFSTVDPVADSELLNRFEDLELANPEFDPSATPPMVSWTWWVEGAFTWDASALPA